MEATFDNKTNVLEANIRATYDNSVIYRIRTTYSGLRGRAVTFLEDANSGILTEGRSTATVGAIHWKEKTLEVHDHKKPCSEIKRRQGSIFSRYATLCRYFRSFPPFYLLSVICERLDKRILRVFDIYFQIEILVLGRRKERVQSRVRRRRMEGMYTLSMIDVVP